MTDYPYFEIDFLNCKINVIFDKNWRKIAINLLKRPLNDEDKDIKSNGMALFVDGKYYIIANTIVASHVIYHECFHILMWISHDFGFEFDVDNQEPLAYLIEYIIDETMKIKNHKLIWVKKPIKQRKGNKKCSQIKK